MCICSQYEEKKKEKERRRRQEHTRGIRMRKPGHRSPCPCEQNSSYPSHQNNSDVHKFSNSWGAHPQGRQIPNTWPSRVVGHSRVANPTNWPPNAAKRVVGPPPPTWRWLLLSDINRLGTEIMTSVSLLMSQTHKLPTYFYTSQQTTWPFHSSTVHPGEGGPGSLSMQYQPSREFLCISSNHGFFALGDPLASLHPKSQLQSNLLIAQPWERGYVYCVKSYEIQKISIYMLWVVTTQSSLLLSLVVFCYQCSMMMIRRQS